MTGRYRAFIVTMEHEVRDDDADGILAALRQLRGVTSVDPVPADITGHIAQSRARSELATKLWRVLYPEDQS